MQSIKWTSLILISILTTVIGNKIAQRYKKRVKELQEIKIILSVIGTKVKFTQQPIVELFEEISKYEQENKESYTSIKKIFKEASKKLKEQSIDESWKEAIEMNKERLNLIEEDISIIERIGKNLGKTDVEGQIKEIEVTKEFIEGQIEKAEEDRKKNEKMYKTLGAVTGIGIVILLI